MMLAEINWEAVGYIMGTFLVPFVIGWLVTKKWYWALLIAIIWVLFKLSNHPAAPSGE